MKRILLLMIPLLLLGACSYDDTDLKKRLDGLDGDVAELQAFVKKLNSQIGALEGLLEGKKFITDVAPGKDGGYIVTMVTSAGEITTLTINDNGGISSLISVKQDSEGDYYWTLNGEYILVDGQKLPVSGSFEPQFKIENGNWYATFDNGESWIECGKAEAEQDLFKEVSVSEDGKLVYLTLADGTVLTFEMYAQFGIAFDTSSAAIRVGETLEIPFKLTGADAKTDIQTIADSGWAVEVKRSGNEGGSISVTAPVDSSTGKVLVFVSDGKNKTLMRTLTFVAGELNVSTTSHEATAAGGPMTIEVDTDLDYTVSIPEAAKAWITQNETRGSEIRHDVLNFTIGANTDMLPRSATIELVAGGNSIESILIYQLGYYDPAIMVLKVEAKEYTSTNAKYSNMVYLPLYGAVDVTINWGDGNSQKVTETIATAATMLNHTYTEKGKYYVSITGSVEKLYGKLTPKAVQPAIVEVIQWGKLGATTTEYLFSGNTSLVALPRPEEGAFANVTSAAYMFTDCTALTTIPEALLAGAPELTVATGLFYNCKSLKIIPEKLFEKTTKVTAAGGLFYGCSALETLPGGLLSNMRELEDLSSIFNGCVALASIPEEIFSQQTKVTSLASAFLGCTALETVPANLFKNMTKNESVSNMFKGCKGLKSIPEGLFDSFGEVTNMTSLLSGCAMLGDLPSTIFNNMVKVKQGGYLFEGCVKITQFPSLKNCISLTTVPALWKDCTQLVNAPSDYFPESVKEGISSSYIFSGCTSLKSVPADMFKDFSGVTIASQMFLNCKALESLPAGILDAMTKLNNVSDAFSGCTAFTGESPYTTVTIDGQPVKIHLYERNKHPELFAEITDKKAANCFKGCTQMADYANIPISWGGISDGTKAKPTLKLSIAPTQGKEYYEMTSNIKGTEMKSGRALCTPKSLLPELIEQMGDLQKVMNRYGSAISVASANSPEGITLTINVYADTDYVFLASGTNAHGTTIEQVEVHSAAIPKGDANYERYIGTWTVTSTSSEIEKKAQTYTVEITPYRTNESFRVKGWGIMTLGDEYPFLLQYNTDGNVSIPTFDPQGIYGLTAYVYLRYHFHNPAQTPAYPIYTTRDVLMTGDYNTADNTVKLNGQKFMYQDVERTVSGIDYAIFSDGQYVVWPDLFKTGFTLQDYAIGPFTLTKTSAAAKAVKPGVARIASDPAPRLMKAPLTL